jgi:hypothetical protein
VSENGIDIFEKAGQYLGNGTYKKILEVRTFLS